MLNAARMQLNGKVAVITGAATGIGEATARLFASEGAAVIVSDINEDKGQCVADDLCRQGMRALFVRTDVTKESDVEMAVKTAVDRFGRLDIMVNNAGIIGAIGSILHTDGAQWHATINVLLNGVFYGTKHAGKQMVAQGNGVILSLASIAGVMGGQGPHAYTAAKHGVIGLTRSAASELSSHGIRVNAVAPAATITPMVELARGGRKEALQYAANISPLRTPQMPEEIAGVLLFLASPAAAHITAQTITVDSGVCLASPAALEKYHSKPNDFLGPKSLLC